MLVPPITEAGVKVRVFGTGALIVIPAVVLLAPTVALIVAVVLVATGDVEKVN
jgi:hypothetical protein